jgi:hypothetical protein
MSIGAVSAAMELPAAGGGAWSFSSVRKKVTTPAVDPSCRREIRVMNAVALRRSFPSRWAEYLRENFASAYAVHKAFPGLDEKTCRDWWHGKAAPSGCFVAAVVASDPNAIKTLGGQP